jgi:aspartate 1-decarboxylase
VLAGKLHRIAVTAAEPDYEGSAGIGREIMEAAGMLSGERVLIGNVRNGQRWETYAFPTWAPGEFSANGGAAHLCEPGDLCVVMWFEQRHVSEAAVGPVYSYATPTILLFDHPDDADWTNAHWRTKGQPW